MLQEKLEEWKKVFKDRRVYKAFDDFADILRSTPGGWTEDSPFFLTIHLGRNGLCFIGTIDDLESELYIPTYSFVDDEERLRRGKEAESKVLQSKDARKLVKYLNSFSDSMRQPLAEAKERLLQRFSGDDLKKHQEAYETLKSITEVACTAAKELSDMLLPGQDVQQGR